MNALGVIPVRIGSTRLARKPLREVNGKPLIQYVYENAKGVKGFDDLVIACDSKEIEDAVAKYGSKAIITRTDHKSGTERLSEVAAQIGADIYVNIQGDEPLANPSDVDRLINEMRSTKEDVATLCVPSEDKAEYKDPHVVKCVLDNSQHAIYFSRSPIPYYRGNGNHRFFKHLGVYAYRRSVILEIPHLKPSKLEVAEALEQLRLIENGYRIKVVLAEHDSLGVDTEDDLSRFKAHIMSRGK